MNEWKQVALIEMAVEWEAKHKERTMERATGHFPKFAGMQGAQYNIKIGHQTHPSQGSRDLGIEGYPSLFFPSLN